MNADSASLERLHDIITPPPAPWWPPPPGWMFVMGGAAAAVLILAARGFIRWQRNRYRREALAVLDQQQEALRDPARRAGALAVIAELLKRAALSAWPRREVASLTGAEWRNFLDLSGGTTAFSGGVGTVLERIGYDPGSAADWDEPKLRELCHLVRHWLAHHRTDFAGRRAKRC